MTKSVCLFLLIFEVKHCIKKIFSFTFLPASIQGSANFTKTLTKTYTYWRLENKNSKGGVVIEVLHFKIHFKYTVWWLKKIAILLNSNQKPFLCGIPRITRNRLKRISSRDRFLNWCSAKYLSSFDKITQKKNKTKSNSVHKG